jgi:phage recombination protein Bet
MNELTTQKRAEVVEVLRNSLYIGAAIASVEMVLSYCDAAGLDVMQKPVHLVPMWDAKSASMRDVVMPGIGLYRTAASRTGQFLGMSEPEFGEDVTASLGGSTITYPRWCKVTIKRELPSGKIAEFTAKELWVENYAVKGGKEKSIAPNAMWTKRPYGQLVKCTEAQALRKAFPELGAAPTAEEMEGKDYAEVKQIDPATGEIKQPAKTLPSYSDSEFTANTAIWQKAIDRQKMTASEVLSRVQTVAALTDAQTAAILSMKPTAQDAPIKETPEQNHSDFVNAMEKTEVTA